MSRYAMIATHVQLDYSEEQVGSFGLNEDSTAVFYGIGRGLAESVREQFAARDEVTSP